MNKQLCNLVLALGLSGMASVTLAAGDATKAEDLVTVCAACHGADGNSPAPNFPKLAGVGEKYLLKQLQDIKAGARSIPEMTGLLDNLSSQQLADIAAFFDSKPMQLAGAKELEVQTNAGVKVDAVELAEKIYRGGDAESGTPACSGCHSPRGLGNEPAAFPRLSGQHAQYIEKQLHDFRVGNRTNDGDAMIMRGVAKHLSDAQIKALANYVAGLN